MLFSLLFAIKLNFMYLHLGIFSFTRSMIIPAQSVLDYRDTTACADMRELRRIRLSSSCGHDELISTHATGGCFWGALRGLYFKTFSPATVLKLFLEHLKMKVLGCFLRSRGIPKLQGTIMVFYTFFPILPFWYLGKCFCQVPIVYTHSSETFNWIDTSGHAGENLDKYLIFT